MEKGADGAGMGHQQEALGEGEWPGHPGPGEVP